jgi:hypothetical protein
LATGPWMRSIAATSGKKDVRHPNGSALSNSLEPTFGGPVLAMLITQVTNKSDQAPTPDALDGCGQGPDSSDFDQEVGELAVGETSDLFVGLLMGSTIDREESFLGGDKCA